MRNDKDFDFLKGEIEKSQRVDRWINIIALILIITFLYILYHYWNLGVMFAAFIIMIGRLPDLIWEIKHGKKLDTNIMTKNAIYYISAFLPWLALPILYFSLYHF